MSDLSNMQNAKETFLATVYTLTLLENCIILNKLMEKKLSKVYQSPNRLQVAEHTESNWEKWFLVS